TFVDLLEATVGSRPVAQHDATYVVDHIDGGRSRLDGEPQRGTLRANGDLAQGPVDAQADRLDPLGRDGNLNIRRLRDRLVVIDEMSGYRQQEFPGRSTPPEGAVTGPLRSVGSGSPDRLVGHLDAVNSNPMYLDTEVSAVTAVGPKSGRPYGGV